MESGKHKPARTRAKDSEGKTSIILREICEDLSIDDLEAIES